MPISSAALTSPATARNRDPILAVLRRVLPAHGLVLEVASGTGEHAVHFAAALPHLTWQPTDLDPEALASIEAHRAAAQLPNVLPAIALDATASRWPVAQADAVVSINMIHIAPWAAAEGLMAGAGRLLAPGARAVSLRAVQGGRTAHRAEQRRVRRKPESTRSGMGRARYRRRVAISPASMDSISRARRHAGQQYEPGLPARAR